MTVLDLLPAFCLKVYKKYSKLIPPPQGLDGRFGDGQTESQGKYSAKEGSKADSLRPQTHMQVNSNLIGKLNFLFFSRWEKRMERARQETGFQL